MKNLNENEMRNVYGGAVTYWYTTNKHCSYYAKSSNYFAEPVAYAKVLFHKKYCSLCSLQKVTFTYYLPSYKK
jgi:bacteriocin-like protein